jgi:hypothetical protein
LSDYRPELPPHATRVLVPGERLLAAVRAMPVGPFGRSLGIFGGAVVGALVHSVAVSRSVKRAALSRFPMAGRMVIGITDHRVLVWRRGGLLGNRTTRPVGEVSLTRIAKIDVEPVQGRSKLVFTFRDARPVAVEADKRDAPERFAQAYQHYVAADGVPAATVSTPVSSTVDYFAPFAPPAGPARPSTPTVPASPRPPALRTAPRPISARHSALGKVRPAAWPFAAKVGAAAFITVAIAVASVVAARSLHGSDQPAPVRISIPESIAGAQRIVTPEAHQTEQRILQRARGHGLVGKAALYGAGGVASFAVVVYENRAGLGDDAQFLMDPLVGAVGGSGTGSFTDPSTMTVDASGDAIYRCAQAFGPAAGASCVWQDSSVIGVVLALNQGIPQARVLTESVRGAVETRPQPESGPSSVMPA